MRKFKLLSATLVTLSLSACMVAGLCACGETPEEPPAGTLYKVSYTAGDGTGTAPETKSYAAGTVITLEENPFTYEEHTFAGWSYNGQTYAAGASYTVPESDTAFVASWEPSAPEVTYYTVSYEAGGGTGTAPEAETYASGTTIKVRHNPFTYKGYIFDGWSFGGETYMGGDDYTVLANTVFVATWLKEPHPAFSEESYEYDRIGGNALELPFDLDGANFVGIRVNNADVNRSYVSYDNAKGAIVISSDYILTLDEGEYTVTAITDADEGDVVCTLTITQSVKTTFDTVTQKAYVYGKEEGVTFTVGYNTTTPTRLMQVRENEEDIEIPSEYWTYDATTFTVKGTWLAKNSTATEYRVFLSNNDSYTFTVTNNVLFASDYDVATIHDETASDAGLNPLYQSPSAVEIAQSPLEMNSGKALKITPNTEEVHETLRLHGYLTIQRDTNNYTWYKAPFKSDKYYAITFDYLTQNTEETAGTEFFYGSDNKVWKVNLLLGPENDDTLHHFSTVATYEQIGNGVYLWAYFKDGGGTVWVDNFKVTELDAMPTLSVTDDYSGTDDFTAINFNPAGLTYEILIDGNKVESSLKGDTLTIPEAAMQELEIGEHTIAMNSTVFGVLVSTTFNVTDNRVAELSETSKDYYAERGGDVVFQGTFSQTLQLVSLNLVDRAYDGGYGSKWEFLFYDTETNYKDYAVLTCGDNNEGSLTLEAELLAKFCGQTDFIAEFNNGKKINFSVNIKDVLFASNYEDLSIRGYLNGSPVVPDLLNSGMTQSVADYAPRDDGKDGTAYFVRATQGSIAATTYTIKFGDESWEWYTVKGEAGNLYRVTFEYKIAGGLSDVYFAVSYAKGEEELDETVFGGYNTTLNAAGKDWARYDLVADGQVHTFDSGWFTYHAKKVIKIQLPFFTAEDGKYLMVDDFRIVSAGPVTVQSPATYRKSSESVLELDLGSKTVKSVSVDGKSFQYTEAGGKVKLDGTALDALELGRHSVIVVAQDYSYIAETFTVLGPEKAELTETSKTVVHGASGDVKLAGEFSEGVTVTQLTRTGTIQWDGNGEMDTSYITMETDGLKLARALVDQVYKTCTYTAVLSNGESLTFTLTSNLVWFSNYDETCVVGLTPANMPTCQDTAMISVVKDAEGNGSHLEYRPENAKEGHSTNAFTLYGGSNGAFTYCNQQSTVADPKNTKGWGWYNLDIPATGRIEIFFDYEIERNGKEATFRLRKNHNDTYGDEISMDTTYEIGADTKDVQGNAKGHFSLVIDSSEFLNFGIYCFMHSKDECVGCVMKVDNFGIAYTQE